ncbi:efflux RND transporter periplasmic adaptor subunit [soil metagenome]
MKIQSQKIRLLLWNAFLAFALASGPITISVAQQSDGMSMKMDNKEAVGEMPKSSIAGRKTVMLTPRQQQLIGVRTATATEGRLVRTIDLYGRIDYDESRVYEINAKTAGYIGELAVSKTGEFVAKGALLFTLYSPELYQAQEELLQAVETRGKLGSAWEPLVKAARDRLKLWDVTGKQIDELVKSGKTEKYLRIYAPVSGIVVSKAAFGERAIKEGETIYKITNLDQVWLEADAYEEDLALIHKGQKAEVSLAYYPAKGFTATVDFIYPFLESMTRTTRVRFVLDNPEGELKPGMYAQVSFQAKLDSTVLVPRSAVLDTGKRQIVFVAQAEGIYVPREVKKGFTAGDTTQILSGLEPGTVVVTSGNFLIDSESQLSATSGGSMPGMKMDK